MKKKSLSYRYRRIPAIIWVIVGLVVIGLGILIFDFLYQPDSPAGVVQSEETVPRVSVQETYEAVKNGQAILLDTRSLESYQQGHAAGSISFPLAEVESRLGELVKDQWYITYCT